METQDIYLETRTRDKGQDGDGVGTICPGSEQKGQGVGLTPEDETKGIPLDYLGGSDGRTT